jgi:hypothetical protein
MISRLRRIGGQERLESAPFLVLGQSGRRVSRRQEENHHHLGNHEHQEEEAAETGQIPRRQGTAAEEIANGINLARKPEPVKEDNDAEQKDGIDGAQQVQAAATGDAHHVEPEQGPQKLEPPVAEKQGDDHEKQAAE